MIELDRGLDARLLQVQEATLGANRTQGNALSGILLGQRELDGIPVCA